MAGEIVMHGAAVATIAQLIPASSVLAAAVVSKHGR
jgi:hypothetical protein